MNAAAMLEMLQSEDGIPQADMQQDNGWIFSREKGVCRMFSFNDKLMLQADPSNPANSSLRFQMIDGDIPEPDGAQVKVMLVLRDKADAQFGGYEATALVSKAPMPTYVIALSMKELAAKYPNGFQMMLMDATGSNKIMQSDTLGSGKHLAALAKCEG